MAYFNVSIMEKRKLSILFITNEYPIYIGGKIKSYGGQASYIENITNLLVKKKNINISIWVLSDRNSFYRKKKIEIREIGFNCSFFGKYKVFINSILISIYILFLNKSKFDIIQYPSFFPLGFFVFFSKKTQKICRLSGITKFWRRIDSKKRKLFHIISDKIEDTRVLKANKVFAPSIKISELAKKYYKRDVGFCQSPLISVKNNFLPKKKISQKKFFLYVGTLNKQKGVDLLCKAITKIFTKNNNINLVLIGRNEKINGINSLDYINKVCKKYRFRIHYLGTLKKKSIYYYYKKALAVIIPSRIDNFPNVLLESLTFKKIIISYYNTSIDEIIVDKLNGFIAKKKNYICLAKTLNFFLKQSNKHKKKIMKNISKLRTRLLRIDYAQEHLNYYGVN